ncbi:MAG TPA: isoaspartyl peptidase/L-asparaginase [Chitinophagales bacterium]|nr:isoaspartyl peptidase/L-asparaginase [Chitinophagales bacterium]
MKKFGIVVHGGAGTLSRKKMTAEKEKIYRAGLEEAIQTGYRVLQKEGSSLDAVEAAVCTLENNPHFNAGRGAVFNHEGKHEMDAAIMEGKNLMAGAVCAVGSIVNPVSLAKEVMLHSNHVMLCGAGAEEFARSRKLESADEDYFFTQHRYDQLQRSRKKKVIQLDDGSTKKFGTVGAVALDAEGNLAAATSTGGITNKRFGRVGDSPIIGAGTYANNSTCAISCTGHGEYFIRAVAAHDVHALMAYKGWSLKKACDFVVNKKLVAMKGEGGLIAIDRLCNIELPFNSAGMYRGYRTNSSKAFIAIFRE